MNKKYEELDFTDDFFFCKILMKNQKLCKELLEMILRIKIAKIVFAEKQKPIEITLDGKGVRLDVYVGDDTKTVYDIEMQPTMKKNLPKRSRYYQGMIDLNLIERGANYKELKKSYVIFICLTDPFDKGLHIYTFENQCLECPGLLLGDETTKVFINANGTADDVSSEMKDFLDYLQGKGTNSDFTRRINDEVNKARAHEEWKVEYMSLFLRDQEKIEEGEEKTRHTMVKNMLRGNEPIEKICLYAECDEAYVREVQAELESENTNTTTAPPLLSLIPIPALTMDELDISFDMEVKNTKWSTDQTHTDASVTAGHNSRFGLVSPITGSVSANTKRERQTDSSAANNIRARATQQPSSEGMAKLASLLEQSIKPISGQES